MRLTEQNFQLSSLALGRSLWQIGKEDSGWSFGFCYGTIVKLISRISKIIFMVLRVVLFGEDTISGVQGLLLVFGHRSLLVGFGEFLGC